MKSIAFIYTVKPVLNTFVPQLKELLDEEIKVSNLFDDFLASDPNDTGIFSITNKNRLFNDIKNCELTGSDIIVVTCSTLSPIVAQIRPFIKVPVVAIDDAMCFKAITYGKRIRVIATANSTIAPTVTKLKDEASKKNVELKIESSDDAIAYSAMKKGNIELHDKRVLQTISEVKDYDVIVLAQASMAHLAKEGSNLCGLPVLSSPSLCQKQILNILKEL